MSELKPEEIVTALKAAGEEDAGHKTAILSNGSPKMLEAAVRSAGLSHLLDELISIEAAGIYKPHASVYQLAIDRTGAAQASDICFISANTWDVQGGAHFGFQAVRIERVPSPDDIIPGAPAARIAGLDELPGLIG